MKSKLALILTVILFCGFSFRNNSEVKPAKILTQMFDSIKGIKTLRQSVHAIERIENHFNTSFSEIKLQTSPRKLYYHNKLKKIERKNPGAWKSRSPVRVREWYVRTYVHTFVRVVLLHDSVDVQQTAGQVPFNTARADAAPFQSMKEAIKYNKESKSGYTRRELQMLTLKPFEHDACI